MICVCNSKFGLYMEVVMMGNGEVGVNVGRLVLYNANYLIQETYLAKWSYSDF